ncbi:DUF3068 domain-containing protein [Marinactinospora rubrisoli]|uniref:DUF3068 domain-containing protein n=1 Tax=Marinactinospora rubrisoli TaxID=2715399 RepID=A0ABW2KDK8_9ACTN
MRRTLALVCVTLGVFSLALAPMLRFWVAPALMRTPMDYYNEVVNHGENVSYFSAEDLESVEGATVEAYSTFRADVPASDSDVVVWDQFTWVTDVDRDYPIQSTTRRAGHDRFTGQAVDCCDPSVNGERAEQSGQVFKFPFLTERRDYEFFDTTTRRTWPIEFRGEETVHGVPTYRFVQVIEPTRVGERTMPRSLLGMDGEGDVTADEMFSLTRTYWIEPTTGIPIDLEERHHRAASVDGEERLVLFDGVLRFTEETTEGYIESATPGMTRLPLVRETLPITLAGAGAALVVVGLLLPVLRRRT